MEIVIKIPELYYKELITTDDFYLDSLGKAVKNDISLPKHHGRLGDLDAIEKEMTKYTNTLSLAYDEAERIVLLMNHFDLAPTIIEADEGSESE